MSYTYLKEKNSSIEKIKQFVDIYAKPYLFFTALQVIGVFILLTVFSKINLDPDRNLLVEETAPTPVISSQVLGAEVTIEPTATPLPSPTVIPTPTPGKKYYNIVVYGDSEVETMGVLVSYLQDSLKKKYPQTQFLMYNYGLGSETVKDGLARFNSDFKHDIRNYPSVPNLKPDIIILTCFSYNPTSTPYDRNANWIGCTQLIQAALKVTKNVYILAEIAPLRKDFGIGPHGTNWDEKKNVEHSGYIIEQIENAIGLSKELKVSLIDAFTPSIDEKASILQGAKDLINSDDGIHPSKKGHEFIAEKITEVIQLDERN